MNIILFLVFGFVAGLIARMLMPGSHPMGVLATMLLGIVGSFVGGFLASIIFGYPAMEFHSSGLISSVLGSMVLLFVTGFAYYPRGPRFMAR